VLRGDAPIFSGKARASFLCVHNYPDVREGTIQLSSPSVLTRLNQTKPNQTKPNQTKPNQAISLLVNLLTIHRRPIIDYQMNLSTYDRKVFKWMYKKVLHLSTQTPWGQKYVSNVVFPTPADLENLDQSISDYVGIGWHPSGTCRMGDCVDTNLTVIGGSNLRVVDAAVFPTQGTHWTGIANAGLLTNFFGFAVDGNPVYTIFAVAEKVSDLIKQKWL